MQSRNQTWIGMSSPWHYHTVYYNTLSGIEEIPSIWRNPVLINEHWKSWHVGAQRGWGQWGPLQPHPHGGFPSTLLWWGVLVLVRAFYLVVLSIIKWAIPPTLHISKWSLFQGVCRGAYTVAKGGTKMQRIIMSLEPRRLPPLCYCWHANCATNDPQKTVNKYKVAGDRQSLKVLFLNMFAGECSVLYCKLILGWELELFKMPV